jgi:primary-amine oxidase
MSGLSLAPLSPAEISSVISTIKSKHPALTSRKGFLFVECGLFAPNKYAVLHSRSNELMFEALEGNMLEQAKKNMDWKRSAFVVMYSRGKTYEAVVRLDGIIDSWVELEGVQPSMSAEEYEICENAVKSSPEVFEVLKKRGISGMDRVTVDAWCTGPWIHPGDKPDRRLARPLLFLNGETSENVYARPIEGCDVLVDLELGKVVSVLDKGKYLIPEYDSMSQYNEKMKPSECAQAAPLSITQPKGTSFKLDGYKVQWLQWEFQVGFSSREGLILWCMNYKDPDRNVKRLVAYRMCSTEMVVPYGSPEEPSWRKSAFDAGEDGLGKNANSLRKGESCDCLGEIHYWDAHFVNASGQVTTTKNAVCMHEEDYGILYKHTDWRNKQTDVCRGRRLVISFIATVANYDYGFYWYLLQDGSIEHEVKATGILSTSVLRPETRKYGVPIAPGLNAVTHQHFFTCRLDMAIDGVQNSVYEINVQSEKDCTKVNPWGNAFYHTETLLKTENEARRDINPLSGRRWQIVSNSTKNRVGSRCGYELRPGDNVKSFLLPRSSTMKRAGFLKHHFWVSEYNPTERYVAGAYPNQRSHDDGVSVWTTKRNADIVGKDIVLWYTFGLMHVVRIEDWPLMPVELIGFKIKPVNFFDRNPTMGLPSRM